MRARQQAGTPSGSSPQMVSSVRASVGRALAAVKATLAADPAAVPSLAALAEAAGVSPRSLQRHFVMVLGRSPQAVLQQLRLAAARQTLRSGEVSLVLDAALRHGFEHPGRFAIAYASAFAEAPSATLRAARARATAATGRFNKATQWDWSWPASQGEGSRTDATRGRARRGHSVVPADLL